MRMEMREQETLIDRTPQHTHQQREKKKVLAETPKTPVWVSLGDTKIAYRPDISSAITVTGETTWQKYMETHRQHLHGDQTPHPQRRHETRQIRFSETKITADDTQTITAHGPYAATFNIDGIAITLRTFVTADKNLSRPFILQQECWFQHEFKYVEHHSHPVTQHSQTILLFNEVPHVTLIDTGAQPSVMTLHTFISMGGDENTLRPTKTTLLAASGDIMASPGITGLIPFRLGSFQCHWPFILVHTLGGEDVILGRDFLNWHKASINLYKKELSIQQPATLFDARDQPIAPFYRLSARCVQEVLIPPGMTKEVDMMLDEDDTQEEPRTEPQSTKQQRTIYVRGDNNTFSPTSGLSSIHELTTVNKNVFRLSIRNSSTQQFRTSLRDRTVISVHKTTCDNEDHEEENPLTRTRSRMSQGHRHTHTIHRIKQDHHSDDSSSGCSGTLGEEDDFPITPNTQHTEQQHETDDSTPRDISSDTRPAHLTFPHFAITSENLDDEQLQSLQHILHSHADTFSKSSADLGRTHLLTHDIDLQEDAKPFRTTLHRTSGSNKTFAAQTITDLLHMGLIRESKSPFASPSEALYDKLGTLHFGVDFRRLNELTIRTPDIHEDHHQKLEELTNANYFSTIKMGPAFWQIPIRNSDKHKTAFVTNMGLFEWEVIPFGICNASATFQRLMTKVLPDHDNQPDDLIWCTGDVIIIATTTIHQHLQRLQTTLSNLRKAQLKIKPSHCRFFRTRLKLMGRIIENNQLSLDPIRQQTINTWEPPLDKVQLQSFIQIVQYYREFIPNHVTLITPLKLLQRKHVTYNWDQQAQRTFDSLKQILTSEPILREPRPEGKYVLDTDASAVAISGILQQWQTTPYGWKLCVISYGSRALREEERNYGAPKAEMLAVLTFYERYKTILGDNEFDLRCDAQALKYINTWQITDYAMYGWVLRLSMANYHYEHRLRDKHRNADSLTKQTQHYHKGEPRPAIAHGFPFISQEDYDNIEPLPPEPQKNEEMTHLHGIHSTWDKHTDLAGDATGSQEEDMRETYVRPSNTSASSQKKRPRAHSPCAQTHNNNNTRTPQTITHYNQETTMTRASHQRERRTQNQQPLKRQRKHMNTPIELHPYQTPCLGTKDWYNTHNKVPKHTHTGRKSQRCNRLRLQPQRTTKQLELAQKADVALNVYRAWVCADITTRDAIMAPQIAALTKAEITFFNTKKHRMAINREEILYLQPNPRVTKELNTTLIILPQLYRIQALIAAHERMAHTGQIPVFARLKVKYAWPGMKLDVIQHVNNCRPCQAAKGTNPKIRHPLKSIVTTRPNEHVQLDFEQYSKSAKGNRGLLVCVDHFSKYCEVYILSRFSTAAAAKMFFENWVLRYGPPDIIQSDQGPQFESQLFHAFCEFADIRKQHSTAYRPQTQGLVERMNRHLTAMLRTAITDNQEDWDDKVQMLVFAYNNTIHSTTGVTPESLFALRGPPRIPLHWMFANIELPRGKNTNTELQPFVELPQRFADVHETAKRFADVRINTAKAQKRQKRNHDKHIKNTASYEIGALVMAWTGVTPPAGVEKLTSHWRGPFRIINKTTDGINYALNNGKISHVANLKPYKEGILDLAMGEDEQIAIRWEGPNNPEDNQDPAPKPNDRKQPSQHPQKGKGRRWDIPTRQPQYEQHIQGKPKPVAQGQNYIADPDRQRTKDDPESISSSDSSSEVNTSLATPIAAGLPSLEDIDLIPRAPDSSDASDSGSEESLFDEFPQSMAQQEEPRTYKQPHSQSHAKQPTQSQLMDHDYATTDSQASQRSQKPGTSKAQCMSIQLPAWHTDRYPEYSHHIQYRETLIFDEPHALAFMTSATLDDYTHTAIMFRRKFRNIQKLFTQRAHVGHIAVLSPQDIEEPGKHIYYLFTTTRPTEQHTTSTIRSTVREMINHATTNDITTISIPIPYILDDGVSWRDIYAILHESLQHTNIQLLAHRYFLPISERTALIRLRKTRTT
jgi:transposase InsO family protein